LPGSSEFLTIAGSNPKPVLACCTIGSQSWCLGCDESGRSPTVFGRELGPGYEPAGPAPHDRLAHSELLSGIAGHKPPNIEPFPVKVQLSRVAQSYVDVTNEQLGNLSDVGMFSTRVLKKMRTPRALAKKRNNIVILSPEKLDLD
jgi:hypothetical protein